MTSGNIDMAQVDVTFEDQQKINTFSRLNSKLHETEASISSKKAEMEDLEEAGNEIMLLDDEEVPYVIGECFVYLPKEQVEEKLEQGQRELQEQVDQLEEELKGIKVKMAELKTVLYGKFGNAINLEE